MIKLHRPVRHNERGAAFTEVAVMLSFIILLSIISMQYLSRGVRTSMDTASGSFGDAGSGGGINMNPLECKDGRCDDSNSNFF